MKVLFTADWHIKLGQKNVPIEWQKNRFNSLVEQLNSIPCDLMIIGGDIFDRVPTLEELELYFSLVATIKHKTIIYAGNHEALKKNTTFLTKLRLVTQAVNPLVEIIDDFLTIENMDFIPYNKLREPWPEFRGAICFSHCRGEIPPHVKSEVDLSLFDTWNVCFFGDLHSHSNSQGSLIYPGSPLTTSFHRNLVDTGIIFLDSETLKWEFIKLELPQLLRKTISNKAEIIQTDYHHTIYELEGNIGDLKGRETDPLLDKKLIQREYASSLNLANKQTIQEELSAYLEEILKIDNIDEVLKVSNDYIEKTRVV